MRGRGPRSTHRAPRGTDPWRGPCATSPTASFFKAQKCHWSASLRQHHLVPGLAETAGPGNQIPKICKICESSFNPT